MKKFGLTEKTINEIQTVFARYPAVEKVMIYGSRAKGNYKNGSDIDLTLIGEKISDADFIHIRSDLDDMLTPYTFDLSLFQQIDHAELIEHIRHVGCVFYEKPRQ